MWLVFGVRVSFRGFKTNHRLLHPFVLALFFNKKPENTEHISMIKKKIKKKLKIKIKKKKEKKKKRKIRTSLINRRLLPLADAN
jgi:hypothetical protein